MFESLILFIYFLLADQVFLLLHEIQTFMFVVRGVLGQVRGAGQSWGGCMLVSLLLIYQERGTL